MESDFENRLENLKAVRDRMLAFHKLLIDRERKELERHSGNITPGQFLGMLMNDERFEWLRTISRIVVRIDEAFELDDGMPVELVVKFESEIATMFDESGSHSEFKSEVMSRMATLPEAESIRVEIVSRVP